MKYIPNKILRAVTVAPSLDFCRDVMVKMRDMGYEMMAVSSPGPELDSLRDDSGFHCVAVPMARRFSVFADIHSLFSMVRVFRTERPQVVHSMTPKAGLICMLAGWMVGVPVRIHTITGLVWPTSSGIKRTILKMTDRVTCACATYVIPEGQGVLNDLRDGHITDKPMKVLGYGNVRGVDMERFDPGRFVAGKSKGFTFLFVGRIVGDKGINELVQAFVRLYNEYPGIRLVLVGDYEASLDPIKKQTYDIIQNHPSIVADGQKSGDDLLQEYMDADCFVMPSYREGFPNTVLEAGAMKLPSIVTDINGSREIIENEKNGLTVPSKDSGALYEAMKRMYEDASLRESMSANARPMIESRFEMDFVQQCLIDCYKEILESV